MKIEYILNLIAAILLLLCLGDWDYGYYQFVRFFVSAFFCYKILIRNNANRKIDDISFLYLIIILLFQPFYKVALGRTIWNIVDVVLAGYLITEILRNKFRL